MKKTLFLAAGILGFMLCGSSQLNNVKAQDIIIEFPVPDTPTENLCRCNDGECKGGNLISFRRRCGQGDCSEGQGNC